MFKSQRGSLDIAVHSLFRANDARVILEAVRRGLGLGILPDYLIEEDLGSGALIRVLEEYPVMDLWLKAQVPNMKINKPAVKELVKYLKERMQPVPPWEEKMRSAVA